MCLMHSFYEKSRILHFFRLNCQKNTFDGKYDRSFSKIIQNTLQVVILYMVTPGGSNTQILAKIVKNTGFTTITHQFGPFNRTKLSQKLIRSGDVNFWHVYIYNMLYCRNVLHHTTIKLPVFILHGISDNLQKTHFSNHFRWS